MSLMTETVVLRFRGGESGDFDDLGNPIREPDRDESWPCWLEPRGSTEHEDAREQQIWGYWVYLPGDAPLAGADAVVYLGVEYQVVGEPGFQPGGFLVDSYVKAAIQKWTG